MPVSASQFRSFLAAAERAADPRCALRPHLEKLVRESAESFHLLAFGKASLEMADEALLVLGARIAGGVVTCVPERLDSLSPDRRGAFDAAKFELFPADHPLATQRNVAAAMRVGEFIRSLAPSGHLLVLISGGGSAHLTLPAPELSLEHLRDVTQLLNRAGCDIRELNAVRKHCEQLKGGRLGGMCRARDVRMLVLSDVLSNGGPDGLVEPLDVISSGPFTPDPTTYSDALAILEDVDGWNRAPEIMQHLQRGERGEIPETPKPGDPSPGSISTTVLGGNRQLVDALADHAASLNLPVVAKWYDTSGDADDIAERIVAFVRSQPAAAAPRALIVGGEWTVSVGESSGTGGPSQHLALALAIGFAGTTAGALVYSSDGIDGPTDGAGAIVDGNTMSAAIGAGLDPRTSLANRDSHSLFAVLHAKGASHLRPGPTGTNVNHVAVVLF